MKKILSSLLATCILALPLSAFAATAVFKVGNGQYSVNGTLRPSDRVAALDRKVEFPFLN